MRCVHEASLYENNSFITLTYNDSHLPAGGTLVPEHFQKFMKRLRKKFSESPIRFYHCGEYGKICSQCRSAQVMKARGCTNLGRPHYHACLFNFDFADKQFFKTIRGHDLYTSDTLGKLWRYGFSTIGQVNFETAAYVARYIMKKINGDDAGRHYENVDHDTGEIHAIYPERTTMSRRPGIASEWYRQFKSDVYPDDFVVLRGRTMNPPRYYDQILQIEDPEMYAALKERRKEELRKHAHNCTPERLKVRETVKKAQVNMLKRSYEEDE